MSPLLPLRCPRAELQVTSLTTDFPLFSGSTALLLPWSPHCGVGILDPPRKAGLVQIPCRSSVAKSFLFYSLKICLFSVSLHLCTYSPALALGKDRASSVARGSPQSSSDTWQPSSALHSELLQPPPGGRFESKLKVAIRSSLSP